MDLLGTTLETSVLTTLNATIRNKQPFPALIPQLESTNFLISKFYNRPRDSSGSSWIICCVDDRRKRVLCAISPETAKQFHDRYQTEITEETDLVIKLLHAPQLSLVSGSFIDSLPPFLPVQYDPTQYKGISDARMILVVTHPVQKVTQGASLQYRFVPMLSVVIDKQDDEFDKPIYPPSRQIKKRKDLQEDYMSQTNVFADLNRLAVPSKGSLDDSAGSKVTEQLLRIGEMHRKSREEKKEQEREAKKRKVEKGKGKATGMEEVVVKEKKQVDHTGYLRGLGVERAEGVDVVSSDTDEEELEYWTEVFGLLDEESEVPRRTPFLEGRKKQS